MCRPYSRPSCPPRPRFLELAHKKGRKRSTYTPFPETGEQINRHTSPRTTYQVKGRPSGRKGADRGAPLPPTCGGPQSSGHSWGSQGHHPAKPPQAGSRLGGKGWCEQARGWGSAPRPLHLARQAPKDTLFLTAPVGRGPGRSRDCSGSGRRRRGLSPGRHLPTAPHVPLRPQRRGGVVMTTARMRLPSPRPPASCTRARVTARR